MNSSTGSLYCLPSMLFSPVIQTANEKILHLEKKKSFLFKYLIKFNSVSSLLTYTGKHIRTCRTSVWPLHSTEFEIDKACYLINVSVVQLTFTKSKVNASICMDTYIYVCQILNETKYNCILDNYK